MYGAQRKSTRVKPRVLQCRMVESNEPGATPVEAPYAALSPDLILDALEAVGLAPTGGLLALNSYENRVYQVALDGDEFCVTKFYRPERWTGDAIREEHAFCEELVEAELSVVAPLTIANETLFEHEGYLYAVYPRQGGHPPNLENPDDLEVLARTIARMHVVGAQRQFEHRQVLSPARLGHDSRTFLLGSAFIPDDILDAYDTTTALLLERIDAMFQDVHGIRIHGDCHMGNILWRDSTPHFVDFDDCVTGPPVQDLWMLLSGDRAEQTAQLATVLDAYLQFYDFALESLHLIEALRTLRIMHHAAWIGRRWSDPAFPIAFPGFDGVRYWSEHLLNLREQQALLEEPPLTYM